MDGRHTAERPLAGELRRLADALSRLVRDHLELARAEAKEDATRLAKDAGLGVAAIPFMVLALLFLHLAAAALLAERLGFPAACAIVGGVDLLVGATLGLTAAYKLKHRELRPLSQTQEELRRDGELVRALRPAREERPALPS